MKILAVIGSPKGKGSGYKVVKMIEDRMRGMGAVEFTYLFLKDIDLQPCTGCYTCMAKGEDKCPLKDDRAALEQTLLSIDGVILSTPLNVLNVSYLMGNFVSRFAYANHRPRFHNLKMMTVVNSGGDSPKIAFSLLRWALGGSRLVHELGVTTPLWPRTERAVAKNEEAIDDAAKKFYTACLNTSLPEPTLGNLFLFYIRQRLFGECREYLPADHAFYSGKSYYYETKLPPVKSAVAKAIVAPLLKLMKNMGPGTIPWPVLKKDASNGER